MPQGQGPSSTGRESYGGCALGVAAANGMPERFSLAFRRCPIDELRPLCHAPENHLRRSSLPSVSDLGHAPVMSSACINGSGAKWPVFLGDSSCASPTAGDGHCRERGCSRRLSDQPSRPRLLRRLAPHRRRASCCHRRMAIVHSNPAGITTVTAVVSVTVTEGQWRCCQCAQSRSLVKREHEKCCYERQPA